MEESEWEAVKGLDAALVGQLVVTVGVREVYDAVCGRSTTLQWGMSDEGLHVVASEEVVYNTELMQRSRSREAGLDNYVLLTTLVPW
jgi:hypothetical protein